MSSSFQDFDIKSLRVFREIVNNGGFAAAQINLNTSASRISTQISDLESRLGVKLCKRGRAGFSLTEAGREIYEHGEQLFRAIEDFRMAASETQLTLSGEIRFGLCDNLATNANIKIPQAINKFKSRKNNVTLDLQIEQPLTLEAGVMDGRLHLAIGVFFHRVRTLNYEPISTEIQYLYCGREHPLFLIKNKNIKIKNLYKYDYANRKQAETEGELSGGFNTVNTTVSSAASNNMEALTILVLSGTYLAFLPEETARAWVEQGYMKKILPEKLNAKTTLNLITKKRANRHHALDIFINDIISLHQVSET